MKLFSKPKYQRILLKLSGEALLGKRDFGIDEVALNEIIAGICDVVELGVEVGIVVGGGNYLRGARLAENGFDRVTGDQMGMLATVMNGLALRECFHHHQIKPHILSSVSMNGLVESLDPQLAISYLENKKVVIFVGGTGSPLFTTDTAASLRGTEIKADIILKATKVDGVFSADPMKNKNAKFFHQLTYAEAIESELGVMDLSAMTLCRDNKKLLRVFNMNKKGALKDIILGKEEGTLITN